MEQICVNNMSNILILGFDWFSKITTAANSWLNGVFHSFYNVNINERWILAEIGFFLFYMIDWCVTGWLIIHFSLISNIYVLNLSTHEWLS